MEQIPTTVSDVTISPQVNPVVCVVRKSNKGSFSSKGTQTSIFSIDPLETPSDRHHMQIHTRNTSASTQTTQWTQRTQPVPARIYTNSSNNGNQQQHRRRKSSLVTVNVNRSSTPIHFLKRAMISTADTRRRGSNGNGDQYQELKSQASNPGLSEESTTDTCGFQYAVTPSMEEEIAQGIAQTNQGTGNNSSSITPAAKQSEQKCISAGGFNYLELLKFQLRKLLGGCPFSISIRFNFGAKKSDKTKASRPRLFEQTLRIKNNREGSCVYQITRTAPGKEEVAEPISSDELKHSFFPFGLNLVKSLEDWNRHYQNPPPHWVVNFIPKAYLRRGHRLAEEICEYLESFPDGCRYRIEYEPIGHAPCLVGIVSSQARNSDANPPERIRHPSRTWERIELGTGTAEAAGAAVAAA